MLPFKIFGFGLFHVELHTDEVLVEEITNFSLREHLSGHALTGATPFGVGIDEDQFVFSFGFLKRFGPGAVEKFNALRGEAAGAKQQGKAK